MYFCDDVVVEERTGGKFVILKGDFCSYGGAVRHMPFGANFWVWVNKNKRRSNPLHAIRIRRGTITDAEYDWALLYISPQVAGRLVVYPVTTIMSQAPVRNASGIKDLKFLSRMHVSGITAFTWSFRNVHAYTYTASRFLDTPLHPLAPMVQKSYAARDEPLWWSCIARRETGRAGRVVRSWLARRTRIAFIESLKKKGYDADGRRLAGTGNETDLYGTAQITPDLTGMKMGFEKLVEQTDRAVLEMISYHGRKRTMSLFEAKNNFGKQRQPRQAQHPASNSFTITRKKM